VPFLPREFVGQNLDTTACTIMAMNTLLDAAQTAARLPWPALVAQIRALLGDASVHVPPRLVQPLAGGGSLFVMPAHDSRVAMTKLITFTPANAGTQRPTIQGDVVVFDVATGERRLVLDGPTVTARRTAAVSLLAAQATAPNREGPLLIVGAGVQGRAHLEAFAQGLPLKEVRVASRSDASARALVEHARSFGLRASLAIEPDDHLAECPLVVTCTPGAGVVLRRMPRDDAFIAAVGAFTPAMVELDPVLCRHCAELGTVIVDTRDADHEAGDLLQAGLDVSAFATLGEVIADAADWTRGPLLFKSCGWAGWDLAAARTALEN
jgi:1-piperideine-2-carboxylate/1-pyrroline-2-carboxylate reductase [NAD(P)H]